MNGEQRAVAEIKLNPCQRWSRFGLKPFRFVCHFLSLFAVTALVITHSRETSSVQRKGENFWADVLFPLNPDDAPSTIVKLGTDIDLNPFENQPLASYYITSSLHLINDTNRLVLNFWNQIDSYVACDDVCSHTASGKVILRKYSRNEAFNTSTPHTYDPLYVEVTEHKLRPSDRGMPLETQLRKHFDPDTGEIHLDDDFNSWVERLVDVEVDLALVSNNFVTQFDSIMRNAYTVRVKYNLRTRGEVFVEMLSRVHKFPLECFQDTEGADNSPKRNVALLGNLSEAPSPSSFPGAKQKPPYASIMGSSKILLTMVAFICVLTYQILICKGILDAHKLCQRAGRVAVRTRARYSITLLFFQSYNMSQIFQGTVACCCYMAYTFFVFVGRIPSKPCLLSSKSIDKNHVGFDGMGSDEDQYNMLLAISIILLWFDTLQYMLYNYRLLGYSHHGSSVLLLKRSLLKVFRVAIFVAPVYMGYVIFGVSMFGAQVPQFESFGAAAITLFATLNGDENRQAYEAIQHDCTDCPSPLVAWIYMSTWLCFAMYVFMNIIIAIIEDTWVSLRKYGGGESGGSNESDEYGHRIHILHLSESENVSEICCRSDIVIRNTKLIFDNVVRSIATDIGLK